MRTLPLSLLLCIAGFAQSFPTSVYTPLVAKDNVSTTLLTSMLSGDAVAIVASSSGWTANMVAYICDSTTSTFKCTGSFEAMLVTNVATNVLTVTRGYGGTSAIAHTAGKAVLNAPTSVYNKTVNDEVLSLEHYLFNNQARRAGTVMVYPPLVQFGVGIVVAPDGTLISTSGTATSGLQEAVNYAAIHGNDLHIVGGDEIYTNPSDCVAGNCSGGAVIYNFDAGAKLELKPLQGTHISTGAISLIGSNSTYILGFDTMEMADIIFRGQVVNSGTGGCYQFKPQHGLAQDTAFGIAMSVATISTPNCFADNTTGVLATFDGSVGSINRMTFSFTEMAGGKQAFRVVNGGGFADNHIYSPGAHGQIGTDPIVYIGTSSMNNVWDLDLQGPSTGYGVRTFGSGDVFQNLLVNSGTQSYAIYFESGAAGNTVIPLILNGGTSVGGFSVGGDCASNVIVGAHPAGPSAVVVTLGGSNVAYQNQDCQTETLVISGGTVTVIELGHTNSNWYLTGQTSGAFTLKPGWFLRVAYSVIPTVIKLL